MFIAFTSLSRATEIADVKHIQFMRDCIVELCSQDMQMSSRKAAASISQLSKILKLAAEMKAKVWSLIQMVLAYIKSQVFTL